MIALLSAFVAGCASSGSQSYETIPTSQDAETDASAQSHYADAQAVARKVAAYCDRLLTDPDLEPITAKLPVDLASEHVTFEMLANRDTPTDVEKSTIVLLAEHRAECAKRQAELLIPVFGPPPYWKIHQRQNNTAALAMLYSGKITFGEFNKALQDIAATTHRERAEENYRAEMLRAEYARLGAEQAQARAAQQQADAQERMRLDEQYRANVAAFSQFAKAFAPPQPAPQINCTSQSYGNQTTTTCK